MGLNSEPRKPKIADFRGPNSLKVRVFFDNYSIWRLNRQYMLLCYNKVNTEDKQIVQARLKEKGSHENCSLFSKLFKINFVRTKVHAFRVIFF
jgi:hypothetical protein